MQTDRRTDSERISRPNRPRRMRLPAGGLGRAREKVAGRGRRARSRRAWRSTRPSGSWRRSCRPRRTGRQARAEVNDPARAAAWRRQVPGGPELPTSGSKGLQNCHRRTTEPTVTSLFAVSPKCRSQTVSAERSSSSSTAKCTLSWPNSGRAPTTSYATICSRRTVTAATRRCSIPPNTAPLATANWVIAEQRRTTKSGAKRG